MTGLFGRRNFRKFTIPVTRSYYSCTSTVPNHTVLTQPTRRSLMRSIEAVWMISANVSICWSPNIDLSMENTRSAAAELGVNAKMICAAKLEHGVTGRRNFSQICRGGARNKDERNERNILTLGRKSTFAPSQPPPRMAPPPRAGRPPRRRAA